MNLIRFLTASAFVCSLGLTGCDLIDPAKLAELTHKKSDPTDDKPTDRCKPIDDLAAGCQKPYFEDRDGDGCIDYFVCEDRMDPPPPPPVDVKCYPETRDGVECKVCVDQNGKETERYCAPTPVPTPPPAKCYADDSSGVPCKVCVDEKGNEVRRDCGPAPMPMPMPPPVKCYEDNSSGAPCKVCVDEKGNEVQRYCLPPTK